MLKLIPLFLVSSLPQFSHATNFGKCDMRVREILKAVGYDGKAPALYDHKPCGKARAELHVAESLAVQKSKIKDKRDAYIEFHRTETSKTLFARMIKACRKDLRADNFDGLAAEHLNSDRYRKEPYRELSQKAEIYNGKNPVGVYRTTGGQVAGLQIAISSSLQVNLVLDSACNPDRTVQVGSSTFKPDGSRQSTGYQYISEGLCSDLKGFDQEFIRVVGSENPDPARLETFAKSKGASLFGMNKDLPEIVHQACKFAFPVKQATESGIPAEAGT